FGGGEEEWQRRVRAQKIASVNVGGFREQHQRLGFGVVVRKKSVRLQHQQVMLSLCYMVEFRSENTGRDPLSFWREHRTQPYAIIGSPKNCVRLRSEEHTSELQSHLNLVCRLLLEKKK